MAGNIMITIWTSSNSGRITPKAFTFPGGEESVDVSALPITAERVVVRATLTSSKQVVGVS